jgi:hypothetical protein
MNGVARRMNPATSALTSDMATITPIVSGASAAAVRDAAVSRCTELLGRDGLRPTRQVQAISDATMTIGSDTSEATDVATVRVLRLPLVDRPSRALNIQKKLLLT